MIKHLQDGFTQVAGQVPDQAALFGLLSQVRDLELWRLERLQNPISIRTAIF